MDPFSDLFFLSDSLELVHKIVKYLVLHACTGSTTSYFDSSIEVNKKKFIFRCDAGEGNKT